MRPGTLVACAAVALLPVGPALFAGPPPGAHQQAATWIIDPNHSSVEFRIRHLVSHVTGNFRQWSGTIVGDPADWSTATVAVTIQAASIDTRNGTRDDDLRSDDFFDVTKYPTITFRSTGVEVSGAELRISGDLTMHGVTRPVVLDAEYLGKTGSGDQTKVGFHAETKLDRTDYGVTWNRAVEGGGVLLGDDVEISIDLEARLDQS
ncbi:MAG TPA: YceI family protein [Gemmatimonadales bacterium]|nr:YceI family protein [Gemmatimonadales bacterium]